jgi:hypothetical protein
MEKKDAKIELGENANKGELEKAWCRIGASVYLSKEEAAELVSADPREKGKLFMKIWNAGRVEFDGEIYFPLTDENEDIGIHEVEFSLREGM